MSQIKTEGSAPRVTFALFAYNQERYIEEAVVGALSQTYSNLEIIISDDGSSDATVSVINDIVTRYDGRHDLSVVVRKSNAGWATHVNDVMSVANGELVVVAAGDDVSHPERVSMLVDQWLAAGRPSGIASGMSLIAEDGSRFGGTPKWLRCQGERLEGMSPDELLKTQLSQSRIRFTGCSAAWSKENWSYFGPLAANVVAEDEVLSFRACLRGGGCFCC